MMSKKKACFCALVLLALLTVFYICRDYSLRDSLLPPASAFNPRSHSRQSKKGSVPKWIESGSTSRLFSGEKTRVFPPGDAKLQVPVGRLPGVSSDEKVVEPWCEKWGVLTTIFQVSEAVQRQVMLQGWCLVVVFDKKSTLSYDTGWSQGGEGNKWVVTLSPTEQEKMGHPLRDFVQNLPWNSFGRKNIGYLYAIQHGASVIWDFDDDNALKFWLSGAALPSGLSLDAAIPDREHDTLPVLEPLGHDWPTYNPYPSLHAPTLPSWPRGLPLDDIKETRCHNTSLKVSRIRASTLAVLQSLAEYQPDVDAIFRLTMPIPFFFDRTTETRHVILPRGSFTPYNAQATLHFQRSFFSMYLPITVTGRVSDIWRSYISERLFQEVGLRVGFASRPLVVQDRNQHSNIADLMAEDHLYTRSKQLIEFLQEWRGKGASIVARTEELWIALYEREYIELKDVKLVQLWLKSLVDVGYSFPELVEEDYNYPAYPSPYSSSDAPEEDRACSLGEKEVTLLNADSIYWGNNNPLSVKGEENNNIVVAGSSGWKTRYPSILRQPQVLSINSSASTASALSSPLATKQAERTLQSKYRTLKESADFASVDVLFCQFPAARCQVWAPFNKKTVAFVPAHGYSSGLCTTGEWEQLNVHLQVLAADHERRHIIGAASYFDREYLKHYTGIDALPLHSWCGGGNVVSTHRPYDPKRTSKTILLLSHSNKASHLLKSSKKLSFTMSDELSPPSNLSEYRAVVYFPQTMLSSSLCKCYALGIPLFVPSLKFLQNENMLDDFFDQTKISKLLCSNPNLSIDLLPHHKSTHPYSPNAEGSVYHEAKSYWLQMADSFRWPHITHFHSVSDLEEKMGSADFVKTHQLMMEEVKARKEKLDQRWCKALKNVPTS